jgi:hypothetical protein
MQTLDPEVLALLAQEFIADAKQLQQFINILGLLLTFEDARGAIIGQADLTVCRPRLGTLRTASLAVTKRLP